MIKIAPSILAADFTRLGEEIRSISTAEYVHFDVMDGSFVPNISFGVPVLKAIRPLTDQVLDVHLMIQRPGPMVPRFLEAGADLVMIHLEADEPQNLMDALRVIKAAGKRTGMALKPRTPWNAVLPYLEELDMVLVMTVEPGFGGQSFMADMLPKLRQLRETIERNGLPCDVEVDGGINESTARLCVEAGANVLVAGSTVFGAPDRAAAIKMLRG